MPGIALDPVVDEAVDRLAAEFTAVLSTVEVRTFVVQSRRELTGEPPAALPELVERLARARIHEALEASAAGRRTLPVPDRWPCPALHRPQTMPG